MNWRINIQKEILQKNIIKNLDELMNKLAIKTSKITIEAKSDVYSYQIHFSNESDLPDMDILITELNNAGYITKRFFGNLPESFYLKVMREKPI